LLIGNLIISSYAFSKQLQMRLLERQLNQLIAHWY
jgi:hypothetical protein